MDPLAESGGFLTVSKTLAQGAIVERWCEGGLAHGRAAWQSRHAFDVSVLGWRAGRVCGL